MMQLKTNAVKITKRWIINEVSMSLNNLRSCGIEHKNATMFKNVIRVV